MHLKRNKLEKFWSIPRKGTKYLAVACHNQKESVPLVVIMRDMLKLVKNKKELKKILNEKQIKINQKEIRETNYPVCLFDIINLPNIKKNYKASLSKTKKMIFEEISDKESQAKILKVINKKLLPNKKIQFNLMYGENIISNEKIKTGDSILLDLKNKKIIKIIPMEAGRKAFVIKGKHMGKGGKIENIIEEGGKEIAKIISDGEKINVWTRNIIVTD